jgi:hypothetical protein
LRQVDGDSNCNSDKSSPTVHGFFGAVLVVGLFIVHCALLTISA